MTPQLRVEGSYPDPVTFMLGWFRAKARPWNDDIPDPMLRLERGGSDFLAAVSERLLEVTSAIYSPALYPGSTRVWRRGGYRLFAELDVMERSLSPASSPPEKGPPVEEGGNGHWEGVLAIDRAAFDGFWGMSRIGMLEAHGTNRANILLVSRNGDEVTGYALVGGQWGVAYLHRIAVHPDHTGRGIGSALLDTAMAWGRSQGARTMVLNVRTGNDAARRLYEGHGFTETGTRLQVLRLLN